MTPETPQNAGYMIAAYVVAPFILIGYTWWLWRRARRAGLDDGGEGSSPRSE